MEISTDSQSLAPRSGRPQAGQQRRARRHELRLHGRLNRPQACPRRLQHPQGCRRPSPKRSEARLLWILRDGWYWMTTALKIISTDNQSLAPRSGRPQAGQQRRARRHELRLHGRLNRPQACPRHLQHPQGFRRPSPKRSEVRLLWILRDGWYWMTTAKTSCPRP